MGDATMGGQRPFWEKVVEAIAEIHRLSFRTNDGQTYAVSGRWLHASSDHIRKLLVRCFGVVYPGKRISMLEEGIAEAAVLVCLAHGVSKPRSRHVFEINPARLDALRQFLLSEKPPLCLVRTLNPLEFVLDRAPEDYIPLWELSWTADPA